MSVNRVVKVAFAVVLLVWVRFGEGRRLARFGPAMLRSALLALRSPRFLNIFGAAFVASWVTRRFMAGSRFEARKRTFFGVVWLLYYHFRVREKPHIHFQRSSFNMMLVEKAHLTQRRFNPVFYAFNRHAQSIICYILSLLELAWQQPLRYEREAVLAAGCASGSSTALNSPQFLDWILPSTEQEEIEAAILAGVPLPDRHLTTSDGQAEPEPPMSAAEREDIGVGDHSQNLQTADSANRARTRSGSRSRSRSHLGLNPSMSPRSRSYSTGAHASGVPVIILIHGLGDDREHPYIQRFARRCHAHGWHVAAFSYWRFDFSSGCDVATVVDHVHAQRPLSPLVAVAWSAGGHLLTRYLQEQGKNSPLVTAVTISGCLDLPRATRNVRDNENPTYYLFLTAQAHRCARRHLAYDASLGDELCETLRKAANLQEAKSTENNDNDTLLLPPPAERVDPMRMYDRFQYHLERQKRGEAVDASEREYVPYHQTKSHYNNVSSNYMDQIEVTTLMIHADDDPVVRIRPSEWKALAARNKHIIALHTKRGGHCGWFDGVTPFGATWDCKTACAFISATLECHSQTNFLVNVITSAMRDSGLLAQGPKAVASPRSSSASGTEMEADADSPPAVTISPDRLARICSVSDLSLLSQLPRSS